LLEKGAKWADTPREVAQSCEVVITSLPTPQDVENVVYGADGLKDGWKQGDIFIDMSTNSVSTVRKIAETAKSMGVTVLDAPVSGGTTGAEAGTLAIMVGGDAGALEMVKKVLDTMGQRVFCVGDVGCGTIAKLVNNLIGLGASAITAEGFVLGVKAGIDPDVLQSIIAVSTGNNWTLQQYPRTVLQGDFEPGFRLSLACKDIALATQMAREYGVPLQVGSAVEQRLIEAKAAGLGDKAVDGAILRLEELTGVQVRSQKRSE
jgi:3-hydroxyisobutyrate dehydrogenase-like beta-hydroxyacid dehydrogenase